MEKIFHWSDIYTLGIADLDEQHKKIVDIINRLHQAVNDGKNDDDISRAIQELVEHARTHFNYEENLLKTHGYPELEEHKTYHKQLAAKVMHLQERYLGGDAPSCLEMTNYCKNWLSDHILRIDVRFIPYLKKQ